MKKQLIVVLLLLAILTTVIVVGVRENIKEAEAVMKPNCWATEGCTCWAGYCTDLNGANTSGTCNLAC